MPIPNSNFTTKQPRITRCRANAISALGLTKTYRWVPVLNVGFTGERDTDRVLKYGAVI